MRPATYEYNHSTLSRIINFVNEQKISTYMAFPVSSPITGERVIYPFGRERPIVRNEQHHRLFQAVHIETTGMR